MYVFKLQRNKPSVKISPLFRQMAIATLLSGLSKFTSVLSPRFLCLQTPCRNKLSARQRWQKRQVFRNKLLITWTLSQRRSVSAYLKFQKLLSFWLSVLHATSPFFLTFCSLQWKTIYLIAPFLSAEVKLNYDKFFWFMLPPPQKKKMLQTCYRPLETCCKPV